jgi:hypothetical protein
MAVKNRREFAWHGIVVVFGMIHRNDVHKTLEESACFVGIVTAIHPRIVAYSDSGWEF